MAQILNKKPPTAPDVSVEVPSSETDVSVEVPSSETRVSVEVPSEIEASVETIDLDAECIGKWCVVVYDDMPYPGIIQDIDHSSVEVKVMHRIGDNRFFWPRADDTIWYKHIQVIAMIKEPTHVTQRHWQICPDEWEKINKLCML